MKDVSSIDYSALMAFVDPNNYQDKLTKYSVPRLDVERLARDLDECIEMDKKIELAARVSDETLRRRINI